MAPRTPTTYHYPKLEFTTTGGVVDIPNLLKTIRDAVDIAIFCENAVLIETGVEVTFRDSLPLEQKTLLDAIVANHDGTPLPAGNVDEHGNMIVAPTFLHASEQARLKGVTLTAEADQVAIVDYEVTNELLVQGGQFWVTGAKDGDIASFAIVDKNDVLGLHTQMNIPLGTPIELVKYVDDYPLPAVEIFKDEIIMPTVAPVASGLFIRATLQTSAEVGRRKVGILYRWYVGGI